MILNPKTLFAALFGTSLLFAGPAMAQPARKSVPASAKINDNSDPALWVVKDKDTTIYLFGTIHMLQPGLTWFDEAVKDAFDKSDTLVTEIAQMTDPASVGPMVMKYAVDANGKLLRDKLSAEQRKTYETEIGKLGVPADALDKLDPWYVSTVLAVMQYQKSGMNPESGAEDTLYSAAKKSGKKQVALETMDQQFSWFDATPEKEQVDGLIDVLTKGDEAKKFIEQMTTAWNAGDANGLAAVINESMDKTPTTKKLLLTDRNARWADWIKQRMVTPGTVFVAVGAGHLAGKDSVQDQLKARKLKAKRVNY